MSDSVPDTDQALVKVTLAGAFEPFTTEPLMLEMNVSTVRGVLRMLDQQYPGLAALLEHESAVAIDGVIHEIIYTQPLPPGSEVFFIPKLESG